MVIKVKNTKKYVIYRAFPHYEHKFKLGQWHYRIMNLKGWNVENCHSRIETLNNLRRLTEGVPNLGSVTITRREV